MIASTQTNQPFTGGHVSDQELVDLAAERLRTAGLRVTQPRLRLLAAMSKRREPTRIELLHQDVAASGCVLVTVYRCMAVFEDAGIVQRAFLHDGTTLYSLNIAGAPRYYVMCKATNRIDELDPHFAKLLRGAVAVVEDMLQSRGYRDVTHIVEFFGVRQHRSGRG